MQNELLGDCQEYEEENYSEFLTRYNGFGKEIYEKIKKELPEIFQNIKFYKAVKSTEKCVGDYPFVNDSYGIFTNENLSFEIQLDPNCEVINIYSYDRSFEVGDWSEDIYSESIEFIKNNFI